MFFISKKKFEEEVMRQSEERMKEIYRQNEMNERLRYMGKEMDERIERLAKKIYMLEESVYKDMSDNKKCC